jgi:hypothetical protein
MPKPPSTSKAATPDNPPAPETPAATTTSTITATLESPPPARASKPRNPLFQAPQSSPGPATGSLAADAVVSPNPSAPAAPPARPASVPSTAPSSPSSADAPRTEIKKPVKAEIKKFLTQAVNVGTKTVHRAATFGNDVERNAGLWIATAEEAEAIADPAAALVFDHVPPQLLQSAVIHGARLLFAIVDYVNSHLDTKLALRRVSPSSQNLQVQPQPDVTGEMTRAQ